MLPTRTTLTRGVQELLRSAWCAGLILGGDSALAVFGLGIHAEQHVERHSEIEYVRTKFASGLL